MERLTERDEYGNADIIGVLSETLYSRLGFDDMNRVTSALNRLAAYEDAMPLERVQELAPAERDGRLLVLPPPAKEGDLPPACFYTEPDKPWAWCLGMGKGIDDDEPCERCKACWYLEAAHQEMDQETEE